jgi:aspartokinase/homoserine dehydrogenase 1
MNTTRIHTAKDPAFAEFRADVGQRRPATAQATVEVVVLGHTGQVGSALVARLARLEQQPGEPILRFREGINRSSHLLADQSGTRALQRDAGALADLGHRLLSRARPSVIVDCTADPDLPRRYPEWLRAGIGVITPNKHGFSGELSIYRSIQRAARRGNAPLAYSATVGAGLPILSTLRRLRRADTVPIRLSAVVSGTLSHVFSQMAAGRPLSAAVENARERGFTEPDPLEDLSGRDVARKLVIMLREAGLEDIAVEREPVVADDWARAARASDDAIEALREHDADWRQRFESARAAGETWAYLARFGPEGARVAPLRLPRDSSFARLGGSTNLARIELAEDPGTPLAVQGPGAGVAVTAGAVLADLVDAAGTLCGRR